MSATASKLAGLVMALALLAPPLWAQATRGSLSGRVADDSGAGLPGVTVTATSPALQGTRVTQTNIDGDYTLVAMPLDTYRVGYELEGFVTTVQTLEVSANQTTVSDLSMEISKIIEEIVVSTDCFQTRTPPSLEGLQIHTLLASLKELPVESGLASVQPVRGSPPAPKGDL